MPDKPRNHDKMVVPGDYNLNSLVLTSYNGFTIDLQPLLLEFVLHEDIYQNTLSGQLTIGENVNLIKHVPLIGNEILKVQFKTASREDEISKKFFIYKIENKLSLGEKQNVYTLKFCSQEFINSQQSKISKSFQNTKISEMVGVIYENYLQSDSSKSLIAQTTLFPKNIVIPYQSPLSAINWLAKRAVSQDTKDFSYLFYETMDGFFFNTINYSAKTSKTPIKTYQYYITGHYKDGFDTRNLDEEFSRIESYEIISLNNTLNNIAGGVFASKLLTHDITFKKYSTTNFAYNPDFAELTRINESGILPRNGDIFSDRAYSHFSFYPKHSYLHDDIIDSDEYDVFVQKRLAHMGSFDTLRLQIQINGDSNRRVGDIIEVKLFSTEPKPISMPDIFDPYLSGNYLITRVTHIFSKSSYKMKLQLEKDSLNEAYPEQKNIVDKS